MTPFVFSTLVTSGHQITKFYYINFFEHEVTNFNAPQKPTFFRKKLVWIFSFGAATEMWPQRLGKESPLFEKNCGNWESFHKMGVKKSQKWRNIMKSANFYQIIWDPLQDAIFQKILILKHDFNYSYYPIEGFILIFYLCQTIKEYKSYQKVRFNLGDPVELQNQHLVIFKHSGLLILCFFCT